MLAQRAEKSRRATPAHHRRIVPPQRAHHVINPVGPPQRLKLPIVRQSHHPVVIRMPRVIAPAIIRRQRLDRHCALRRRSAIGAIKHPAHRQHTDSMPFCRPSCLIGPHPATPKRANESLLAHPSNTLSRRTSYRTGSTATATNYPQQVAGTARPWSPNTGRSPPRSAATWTPRAPSISTPHAARDANLFGLLVSSRTRLMPRSSSIRAAAGKPRSSAPQPSARLASSCVQPAVLQRVPPQACSPAQSPAPPLLEPGGSSTLRPPLLPSARSPRATGCRSRISTAQQIPGKTLRVQPHQRRLGQVLAWLHHDRQMLDRPPVLGPERNHLPRPAPAQFVTCAPATRRQTRRRARGIRQHIGRAHHQQPQPSAASAAASGRA